jgi:hypothetical protein
MKSILKLTALLTGAIANVTIAMASAATVGRITIAGDAVITHDRLTFADNSAILTSTFFSGGVDTDENPLPNLELDGPVTIQPISLSRLGTMGGGRPIAPSPLITNNISFYPNNPGEDGSNFMSGSQQFTGATFYGQWRVPVSNGTYVFPGQVSISAQGIPNSSQSFSLSGIANSPVEFEPIAVPEPTTIVSSILGITGLFLSKSINKSPKTK